MLAESCTTLTETAVRDFHRGDYELTLSRLSQISVYLDRIRAIVYDTQHAAD